MQEKKPEPVKEEAKKPDHVAALKTATQLNGSVLVVGPSGDLVHVRPGVISLAASVERGVEIVGMKPGFRLATAADIAEKQAAHKAKMAKRAAEVA